MSLENLTLTTAALRLKPDQPLQESITAMIAAGLECAPVCDGDKVVAVLSLDDVLSDLVPVVARVDHGLTDLAFAGDSLHLLDKQLQQRLTLTTGVAAAPVGPQNVLKIDCPILEAVFLLSRRSPLPVIGPDGELKGMASSADLVRALIKRQEQH
ncbi:MAG: CBS domain-containing protein [Rhodobacteraceae bacterium]|nr:CBS domain-containing protein [Paracoccaceae bacterium]